MKKYIDKITTLIESFPYIKDFSGKTVVIKYGGNAMIDETLKKSFALDMVLLKLVGINPVVVHGGGPQINELLDRVGKQAEFIDGLRVTDHETMEIVEMVLVGKVNKEIVHNINMVGGRAVGLSGKDGSLLIAEKIFHDREGKNFDIGQVGAVRQVNPEILATLDREKFIPVVAPIGYDREGNTLNINADIAAGRIAGALQAEKLILLTDIEGVKIKGELATSLTSQDIERYINSGDITGGMIPKVEFGLNALKEGVGKVHIIDGRVEHAVLLELFTDAGIGTEIISA